MSEEITTIVDQVGRVVIGVETAQTDETLTLNNPVIVHVQPDQQSGQLQVQTFPYLFMEFIEGDRTKNDWTFYKSAIATSNVSLTEQIKAQYKAINNPAPAQPAATEEPAVIKLFDADGN
jgi:hypothetical protein